jgi:hypothetical protein
VNSSLHALAASMPEIKDDENEHRCRETGMTKVSRFRMRENKKADAPYEVEMY